MRTTKNAARGEPLAALIFLLIVVLSLSAVAGERIRVEQTLEWAELEEGLTGLPEKVDLTLLLRGLGPLEGFPIDCILIIDTSATAALSSAKSFAFDLIDQFDEGDRIGLVSYASNARLNIPLTENRLILKTAIGDLKTEGKSALGDAMQLARRELTMVGREDAILVEILLSDGQSNTGIEPDVEGKIAADTGIRVISVGIGALINRNLLQSFANDTDGLYFPRPSAAALVEIIDHLDIDTVASDVRIKKELPAGLKLVASTPRAYQVEIDANGITSAVWRVTDLLIDQEIEFVLEIEATEIGAWADDLDLLVTYTDFRGVDGSVIFPPPNWPPIALFEYEPLAPTTAESIVFTDMSEDANDDGKIVKWEWEFGDEAVSTSTNPEFRFTERGTYMVKLTVTDNRGSKSIAYEQEITVGNAEPVAGFVLRDPDTMAEYAQPHLGVPTMLDASMSYDLDGDIELYKWDFDGDGVLDLETGSSDVEYAFDIPGEIEVTLVVVDDEGSSESYAMIVDILPSILAVRSIETCLPDDWTIQARSIEVSIVISVNTLLNGLSVSETIPSGWIFTEGDNDGATLRQNGQTLEWLFLEKFLDDGINAQREIKYTLTSPASITDELIQSNIHGIVGSSSPRVSLSVSGEDRVTVTKVLPVPVVISRWNTLEATLEPCLLEQIAFDQIQYAVSLWLSGGEVPYSGGATIGLLTMQDLIAYWLTGSSVHDPLP
jgi:PKD repeat protein